MLALSVKLLYDKDAEFSAHSCTFKTGVSNDKGACAMCDLKDIAECSNNNL